MCHCALAYLKMSRIKYMAKSKEKPLLQKAISAHIIKLKSFIKNPRNAPPIKFKGKVYKTLPELIDVKAWVDSFESK